MPEESISVSQYFECPDCKGDVLDEIQYNVVLSSPITDLHGGDGLVEAEYNHTVGWDGGVVDRYQCSKCGWAVTVDGIKLMTDIDDLYVWLQEHKENREKELNNP